MKKIIITTIATFLFTLVFNFDLNAQCAMCRSAVESTMSNGRNNAGVGLNTGILYLLIMPYLLVGAVGYFWYKSSKKNLANRVKLTQQLRKAFNQK